MVNHLMNFTRFLGNVIGVLIIVSLFSIVVRILLMVAYLLIGFMF